MYILIKNGNTPFAIIKNPWKNRVVKALEEEFSINAILFNENEFRFPDYCEFITHSFVGVDDDGENYEDEFEITKLVDY